LGSLIHSTLKNSPALLNAVIEEAKKVNLIISPSFATGCLIALIRDREFSKAKIMLQRFTKDLNLQLDTKLQSLQLTIILRDAEADRLEEALVIYDKLRLDKQVDNSTYHTMIKALIFRKKYDKIELIMKNMQSDGIVPDERFRAYVDFIGTKDPYAAELIQKFL